jgi:hypothetical protein
VPGRRPLGPADASSALLSAPSLVAIALLLINDHLLKAVSPSWLSGKLSDFAGLFFVPFVVLLPALLLVHHPVFTRALVVVVYAGVAFVFVLLKIDAQTNQVLVDAIQSVAPISVVADPTDLVALLVLPASLLLLLRSARSEHEIRMHTPRRRPLTYAVFGVALFGTLATSSSRPYISDLAADSTNPDALYVTLSGTRDDGVYVSLDAGRSWDRVVGLTGSLVRDPDRGNTVYLMSGDSWDPALTRIELGAVPVSIKPPTPGSRPQPVVIEAPNAFAVGRWPQRRLFFARNGILFVSSNEGSSWSVVTAPGVVRGLATTSVQDVLYVVAGSAGLYRSSDAGTTWMFVSGLPANFGAMAVAPDDPELLIIGVGKSLIRSDDAGATWEAVYRDGSGASEARPRWLIEFDSASRRVYSVFGSGCCALLRSSDRGRSWQAAGLDVTELAVAPGGRVFVINAGRTGVLRGSGSPPWFDVDGRLPLQTP